MKKRDAGNAPKLGDRVAYVFTSAAKGTPAYQKAEDPVYALQNSIPIDTTYYLENQLAKPLVRIFEPILGEKAESLLLKGDHTRTRCIATSQVGALAAFTRKKETCLGCKAVLPSDREDKAVCKHCESQEAELFHNELQAQQKLEEKFSRLWAECQRCQGSLHQEVICSKLVVLICNIYCTLFLEIKRYICILNLIHIYLKIINVKDICFKIIIFKHMISVVTVQYFI